MVAGMAVALTAAVVAGVGGTADSGGEYWERSAATFAPPEPGAPAPVAVTYDTALVPGASSIEVHQRTEASGATTVRLRVTGMRAGHTYGAHVHRKPCGTDPEESGGHYQHRPSEATADSEVWLDFTADGEGTGEAVSKHDWGFRPGEASSLVLHGRPGESAARVGCFTMPFGRSAQDTLPTGWSGPAAAAYGSTGRKALPHGWAGQGVLPYGWAGREVVPYGWMEPAAASYNWAGSATGPSWWPR